MAAAGAGPAERGEGAGFYAFWRGVRGWKSGLTCGFVVCRRGGGLALSDLLRVKDGLTGGFVVCGRRRPVEARPGAVEERLTGGFVVRA